MDVLKIVKSLILFIAQVIFQKKINKTLKMPRLKISVYQIGV
jgi:hypothetical protein